MPKCRIRGCKKFTRFKDTKKIYCPMHMARIKRHGHPGLQAGFHKLEKLPHPLVDNFIRKNCKKLSNSSATGSNRVIAAHRRLPRAVE